MKLTDYLTKENVHIGLKQKSKKEAISEHLKTMCEVNDLEEKEKLFSLILEREAIKTTGIGEEISIAHAHYDHIDGICVSLVVDKTGINYDSLDNLPVKIFFIVLANPELNKKYLSLLASISRIFVLKEVKQQILEAETAEEIYQIIREAEKG